MIWPFRRGVTAAEARRAGDRLTWFHCVFRAYEREPRCARTGALVHAAAADCLRLMLRREPTDQEVRAVYDPDIPF